MARGVASARAVLPARPLSAQSFKVLQSWMAVKSAFNVIKNYKYF